MLLNFVLLFRQTAKGLHQNAWAQKEKKKKKKSCCFFIKVHGPHFAFIFLFFLCGPSDTESTLYRKRRKRESRCVVLGIECVRKHVLAHVCEITVAEPLDQKKLCKVAIRI